LPFIGFFGISGLRFSDIAFTGAPFVNGRGCDIGVVGLSCGFVFGIIGACVVFGIASVGTDFISCFGTEGDCHSSESSSAKKLSDIN
jgi:hypothetical protein